MIAYGKTASNGIAAMSYLAEIYDAPVSHAGSSEISKVRELSKPLVAKLLTTLSTAGLVTGTPGPGGGYTLTRKPNKISLMDIVKLFEKSNNELICPFGPNWCGNNDKCPLHNEIEQQTKSAEKFLKETTLDVFVGTEIARRRLNKKSNTTKSTPRY